MFEYFVKPPLEKRLEIWRKEIAQSLRELEENQKIDLEILQNIEQFVSIISQATTIAIRKHQREKLDALKNAIINSATEQNSQEDLQLIFIRFIDELTPSHLHLIKLFVLYEEEISLSKSYPAIYQLLSRIVEDFLTRDQFKLFMGDLASRGLIWISPDIDDFEDIYQASNYLTPNKRRITKINHYRYCKGFSEVHF